MATPILMLKNTFEQELFPVIKAMYGAYRQNNNASLTSFESEARIVLNKIIEDKDCVNFVTTNNTDKPLFGIYVNPTITDETIVNIIFDPKDIELTRYAVEVDLKLFDILTPEDLCAYLIEDITTCTSAVTVNTVRELFNEIIENNAVTINFKNSVNFSQLLAFGIKDTIRKVGSLLYKPEDEAGVNEYAKAFGYDNAIVAIASKIHNNEYVVNSNFNPKLSVLSWVITVYDDPATNYKLMIDTLTTAYDISGSKLEKDEIQKTITSLRRATNETLTEATVVRLREGLSVFKNLKQNGLRSLEDDLYEYKIRIKNCETEEDAMYILRQINTRINILEDYLYNTDGLRESEVNRWTNVINAYKELRIELGKKKIVDHKRYGIYVDYDYLDTLDKGASYRRDYNESGETEEDIDVYTDDNDPNSEDFV